MAIEEYLPKGEVIKYYKFYELDNSPPAILLLVQFVPNGIHEKSFLNYGLLQNILSGNELPVENIQDIGIWNQGRRFYGDIKEDEFYYSVELTYRFWEEEQRLSLHASSRNMKNLEKTVS